MRIYLRDIRHTGLLSDIRTHYLFSSEFIEWSSNHAVFYYSKNIASGIPNNFFEIPIKDATWELFRSSSGDEDSLIFKDDTAALLFKLVWL